MKTLIFCDACGKLMHFQNAEGKKIARCDCGLTKEIEGEISVTESFLRKELGQGIFRENKMIGGFLHTCRKCGYDKCDVEILSAFYSDESDIELYKCKKCGYVERRTDGSSNVH